MFRTILFISTLSFVSGLAHAQVTYAYSETQAVLMCGAAACGAHTQAPYGAATGIDDLNVGGDFFDVNFTNLAPAGPAPAISPFVLANTTAVPGQPLTGIDAGDAIAAFYATLQPPFGSYPIGGDQGPAFVTAFGPAGSLSSEYTPFGQPPVQELYDIVQPNVGGSDYGNVAEAGNLVGTSYFLTANGAIAVGQGGGPFYTTWVPVAAAPEIDLLSAMSALTLLVGGLSVLRGHRAVRRGPRDVPAR
jgi:hypothetical protein